MGWLCITVTCFGITGKRRAPVSVSLHSRDIQFFLILLPRNRKLLWQVVSLWRKGSPARFLLQDGKITTLIWASTLVTICHSAIVTQTLGVNCSCILWQKIDLLFNQGEAQPREIPPAIALLHIPCDLAGWGTPKKLMFMKRAVSPEHLAWLSMGIVSSCPWYHCLASGIFLNQKQDRVLSQHLVADIRHQTALSKKRSPCCQWVCSLLTQSCTQNFSKSNAIANFQQHWHNSKRFPSSQAGNHLIQPDTISLLFSQHTTHISLFSAHLVQKMQQLGAA